MRSSTYDPCFLITKGSYRVGIVRMQIDDTLILCNKQFAKLEDEELAKAKLRAKPKEKLSSTKSKRVTRSSLALEIYGMVAGVDMGIVISVMLKHITEELGLPPIETVVCTDLYSLYECLVKLGTTKEKRLMIDIMSLRESYEERELYEIRWINGKDNLLDVMTKTNPN
ncbi:hypothetical protein LOCC1_G007602 [Lachnellula occidentalis]|uniref:Reverse transcriptase Ty1/copia-type domain-containing protein n=1 Tax=Lachnellula occidentalis TaxID=215460 RepID=A0A8H8RXS5_9HELO|nr:hypothetical protein LOCC1_G007602 [Lachnellula occidentalis]